MPPPRSIYRVHKECYLTYCDKTETVRIFSFQYRASGNMLTIRFQNQNGYKCVKRWIVRN